MNDNPTAASSDVVSFRLEGELAAEVDWIARQDGVPRSEILRRLLLSSLERESRGVSHCLRELGTIEGRLGQIAAKLESEEAEDAAGEVHDAVDSVARAIVELEDFEDEDE